MPAQLEEEEIEEILDTFEESDSCREAADELPHHYNTVVKYVKEAYEEGDPRVEHFEAKDEFDESQQWEGAGPGESPFGEEDDIDLDRDYVGLGPGDFLEEFFDDFEVGVKASWVKIQARRADRRGMLPTKESIKKDILRMKSGIAASAHQEAEYIADEYWAEAREYIRQTGGQVDNQAMSGGQAMGAQQGMPPGGVGNSSQGFVSPGQPQQQPQQQTNPQMQMMQMMMEQMQAMNEQMRQMSQGAQSGGGDPETLERLQRLKQEKKILEELSGGDDQLQEVQRQIQQLQAQAMDAQGAQPPTPAPSDASLEDRLLDIAATDDDVSVQEVIEVIEERQNTMQDPELVEAEKEKEIRMAELEHEQQRYQKFGELAENVFEKVGEGIGSQITGNGAGPASADDSQQEEEIVADGSAEPEAPMGDMTQPDPTTSDPQEQECPHCESAMRVAGNQAHCPECEAGIGPCDICSYPVQIPPLGEADYARCGECESPMEVPDDPDETVECEECEWEGTAEGLRGELLMCEGCGNLRPIQRQPDPEAQQDAFEELLEG